MIQLFIYLVFISWFNWSFIWEIIDIPILISATEPLEDAKLPTEPPKVETEAEKLPTEPPKVETEAAKLPTEPPKVETEPAKLPTEPARDDCYITMSADSSVKPVLAWVNQLYTCIYITFIF